jgi:hypothetical protein
MASKYPSFSGQRGFKSPSSKSGNPISGWGSQVDTENRRAKESTAIEDAKRNQLEKEMVMRVVYGNTGNQPGESYDASLSRHLQDPALPMTEGEAEFREKPMTFDMLRTVMTRKPETPKTPRAPRAGGIDDTERFITELNTFKPGYKIQIGKDADGSPIMEEASPDHIFRSVSSKFKRYNPKDSRIQEWRDQFVSPTKNQEDAGPSMWDRIKSMATTAGGAIKRGSESIVDKVAPSRPMPSSSNQDAPPRMYPDAVKLADGTWGTQVDGQWYRINIRK